MPTFYTGHRPVLKGGDFEGDASPLDGFPDRNTADRSGEYAVYSHLSELRRGVAQEVQPLNDPGHAYEPKKGWTGVPSSKAL